MQKRESFIPTEDGQERLHVIEWLPDGPANMIFTITHGMVEFIDRYDAFASFLADRGIYCIGHDQRGHGLTAEKEEDLGFFAESRGDERLLDDMALILRHAKARNEKVPVVCMGHSMGSFFMRRFMCLHPDEMDAVVLTGTGDMPKALTRFAEGLASFLVKTKGARYRSRKLTDMVLGANNRPFRPAKTKSDWLTKDESIVEIYESNPLNQFLFTASAYRDFFRLMNQLDKTADLKKLPPELPILLMSGKDDPVGDMGSAISRIQKRYRRAGLKKVYARLYEGDRHEILNELDRDKIYADIYCFLEKNVICPSMNRRRCCV